MRAAAAEALGLLGIESERVVPEIALLLQDGERKVVFVASEALRRFGAVAKPASQRLLQALSTALVQCDHHLITSIVGVLLSASPDAERQIRDYFAGDDPEMCQIAIDVLREQRLQSETSSL
jgi:hypothetical protein